MDFSSWQSLIAGGFSSAQWIVIVITSSSFFAFAARHFTKTAITHRSEVSMQNLRAQHSENLQHLRAQHSENLQRLKSEMEAAANEKLEYVKAEIAIFASNAKDKSDIEKSKHMIVANARATSYPKLVAILRRMKRQFEGLSSATHGDNGGIIDLGKKSKRSELALMTIDELADLEQEFDKELSSVRIFTKRSDYFLPTAVREFCNGCNKKDKLEINRDFLNSIVDKYNDDISYISEEFYKPEIDIKQSGELLGIASALGQHDDASLAQIEADRDEIKNNPDISDADSRLAARKPGTPF